jgi:hypothetical protein
VRAQFDQAFGWPTRLKLSCPPDAADDLLASNVELLP